jgi:hypothetical protein
MVDLGLSIGSTNLVAAPLTGQPTVRRAVLTLFGHRPPEVGMPSQNPQLTARGLVLSGFVERVGDPVPMVAGDGSTHRGERLVVDALDALTRAACPSTAPRVVSVAVPAHWRQSVIDTLGAALRSKPSLSPNGQPVALVSDAVAALTALQTQPGLPARGVVALCDFGASGTSITLADAAAGFRSVGHTVRYDDFSGDLIDQAILFHVLADLEIDPSSTSAVVALTRVRDECRMAKERLSYETATGLRGPLPGSQSTVRLTRAELEALLRDPLDGVIAALDDTLQRNNIARGHLAAIATVGGGARIPLVTQRLSEVMRIPVTTTARSQFIAALGAALIARRGPATEAATGIAMAAHTVARPVAAVGSTAAHTVAASAGVEPLAWSQAASTDDISPGGYQPYDDGAAVDGARPEVRFDHGEYSAVESVPAVPLYRRPRVIFGAAATLALVAATGFILSVRGAGVGTVPAGSTGTSAPSVAASLQAPPPAEPVAPAPEPVPVTVVVTPAPNVPVYTQAPVPLVASPRQVAAPAGPPPVAPAPPPPPPVETSPPFTLPPLFPPDGQTSPGGAAAGTGATTPGSGGTAPGTGGTTSGTGGSPAGGATPGTGGSPAGGGATSGTGGSPAGGGATSGTGGSPAGGGATPGAGGSPAGGGATSGTGGSPAGGSTPVCNARRGAVC